MKKILVTGFGPFDHFSFNPSDEIAKALAQGDNVSHRTLPVVFGESRFALLEALDEVRPDLILCFGLNGTIGHIAIEEVAVNIASSEIPDNSGNKPEDQSVSDSGPLAFRTRLPARKIVDTLREKGIPARSSYSAGVYICNEVFYTLMEWCEKNGSTGGFIHVPMATEMMADNIRMYRTPHMALATMKRAGMIILESSI